MINRHPPRDQFHLAKAKTPARRRSASRITSCPRTLLAKSSWAFAPSTLLLLKISAWTTVCCPLGLRFAQRSTITFAYRGAQLCLLRGAANPANKEPSGVNRPIVPRSDGPAVRMTPCFAGDNPPIAAGESLSQPEDFPQTFCLGSPFLHSSPWHPH
jgi:hypothetical protein